MSWQVERWGGNRNHERRIVFVGSEQLARMWFQRVYEDLRQGIVALINDKGETVERYGAGRGRSPGTIVEFRSKR